MLILGQNLKFIFLLITILGFVITAAVCLLEERLQSYMEIFSGTYLGYFILLWIYSFLTDATASPLFELALGGRHIELILYTSSGIGLVLGTLAVKYEAYQQLKTKILDKTYPK